MTASGAQRRLDELNAKAEDPALWKNPAEAQKLMRERTRCERGLAGFQRARARARRHGRADRPGRGRGRQRAGRRGRAERSRRCASARRSGELESLLSGEADANDCFLEVHAGAGGTESQDWAAMLLRMYMRWAEQHGYKVEWIEESPGEEAGHQVGDDPRQRARTPMAGSRPRAACTGWCASRPSIRNARRHTSFASVWVYPVIDDNIEIEINDGDLQHRHLSRLGRAAASTSTRPRARSASRISRPASSCSARPTARSTATAPRPWRC